MEPGYLIDTNVIIDNFGRKLPAKANEFLITIEPIISAVSKIEVLGWPNASKEQLNPLYAFMELVNILPIDANVIEKTIAIRQTQKIGLGEAIIAATALVYDLVLISRNITDFKNIPGLKLINPYNVA